MDIRPIIVREYLESLTEKEELNRIFPILLESKGFQILSKPTDYLGIQEYGKDIVAIGSDEDKVQKRFYFELKGGSDRDITDSNYYGKDGIHDSIAQASYNKFVSAYPKFDYLPLKIVIVHNGTIKGNVQSTLESFFIQTSKNLENTTLDRWDIHKLASLFSENLFGAYLLTDQKTTKLFNKVLINLNVTDSVSTDFHDLLEILLLKEEWKNYKGNLPRKWVLLFETLKLISFIIYTESKEYNNLDIAKRYLTHLNIRFWYWILKNNIEGDRKIIKYFNQVFLFYFGILKEYFDRTLPLAVLRNGLYSEEVGRYEQIGYTYRTFEFLQYFCFVLNVDKQRNSKFNVTSAKEWLIKLIDENSVSARPLLDIHSIPIIDILILLVEFGELGRAKKYLLEVIAYYKLGKEKYNRIPDANNSIENVIKLTVTGAKPIYYSDSTSPILAVILEFIAFFDLESAFQEMREFVQKHNIDLGVFIPHHGIYSTSKHLIEDKENDLEEQLFSKSVNDGYQSELKLTNVNLENFDLNQDMTFKEFKIKIGARKTEFEYVYRTDKAGFPFLRKLAHIYFKTPYFPDQWRFIELEEAHAPS